MRSFQAQNWVEQGDPKLTLYNPFLDIGFLAVQIVTR